MTITTTCEPPWWISIKSIHVHWNHSMTVMPCMVFEDLVFVFEVTKISQGAYHGTWDFLSDNCHSYCRAWSCEKADRFRPEPMHKLLTYSSMVHPPVHGLWLPTHLFPSWVWWSPARVTLVEWQVILQKGGLGWVGTIGWESKSKWLLEITKIVYWQVAHTERRAQHGMLFSGSQSGAIFQWRLLHRENGVSGGGPIGVQIWSVPNDACKCIIAHRCTCESLFLLQHHHLSWW